MDQGAQVYTCGIYCGITYCSVLFDISFYERYQIHKNYFSKTGLLKKGKSYTVFLFARHTTTYSRTGEVLGEKKTMFVDEPFIFCRSSTGYTFIGDVVDDNILTRYRCL